MRKWSKLLFLLLVGFCLVGCGGEDDDEPVSGSQVVSEGKTIHKIGFACANQSDLYEEALKTTMVSSATELSTEEDSQDTETEEWEWLVRDAGDDAQLQLAQIQELLSMQVEILYLIPVDKDAVTTALEALNEADIPVINLHVRVTEKKLTAAYVGSDNKKAGKLCGTNLTERCPNGGKLLVLECQSEPVVNERISGFEEAIAGAGFEVLSRANIEPTTQAAYTQMQAYLSQYPDIQGVICGNDAIALGALQAVKEAGRTEILLYGGEGSPQVKQEIADSTSPLVGAGALSPIQVGRKAVEIGACILRGEKYESVEIVEPFFMDAQNVALYGIEGWQ